MPVIGVAVAVPEPWASRLQDYRLAIGDPTADGVPSHITLVPPTDLGDLGHDVDLDALAQHLAAAAGTVAPFEVHLRGTATFRPVSPVVFVALAEGISQCEQLADVVRSGPLERDLDFPYHPHVTVAHHLPDDVLDRAFADLADFECRFEVDAFHLYVHHDDAGWVPTRSFTLR